MQAKAVLSVENQRLDQIIKYLEKLEKCTPSKEVLLETKIGHVLNKLRKHDEVAVRELATKIFKNWKQFYRERKQRQSIEVRSDAKTELLRMKARRMIADSLKLNVSVFYQGN